MINSSNLNAYLRAKAGIKKASKYHNSRIDVDGMKFDSKKEYEYYLYLQGLVRKGKATNLRRQVPFVLQDGFTDRYGQKQSPIRYVADFVYTNSDGETVVVDVKSKITEANQTYRLKRKMFLKRYPEVAFVEVVR